MNIITIPRCYLHLKFDMITKYSFFDAKFIYEYVNVEIVFSLEGVIQIIFTEFKVILVRMIYKVSKVDAF